MTDDDDGCFLLIRADGGALMNGFFGCQFRVVPQTLKEELVMVVAWSYSWASS